MGIFDKIKSKLDLNSLEKRKKELINKNTQIKSSSDTEVAEQIAEELMQIENKIQELKSR
jgi:glucosamine 6-phosphate synthetase-like amidotransferase/phosphosugar isomerase protein